LVSLNEGHQWSYSRDELVKMLDEKLFAADPLGVINTALFLSDEE
jgi:hypothetical protein